jgi:hypothetical protein
MSIEIYMQCTVEFAIFLGMSDDRIIQPDAAVAELESLAAILQRLNQNDRDHFRTFVEQLAANEKAISGITARAEFLQSLTENLGLS